MRSRFLLTISLLFVVAASFVTIGMAYTASTDNTGNTVTSEYVVLEQFNYSLSSEDGLRFDIVTTEAGTVYQIPRVVPLIDIDGAQYYGFKVGEDQLTAHVVGSERSNLDVFVETSDLIGGVGFSAFGDYQDWRYILKVEYNRFIVLIDRDYLLAHPLSGINVVKIGSDGVPSLLTGQTAETSIPGTAWRVWGNSSPSTYSVNEDDVCKISENKFIVLVDSGVTLSNYNVVKISASSSLEIGVSEGTSVGTWSVWGAEADTYTVNDANAYPNDVKISTQYAYYDGTGTGDSIKWKVINTDSVSYMADKFPNNPISGEWRVWGEGDISSNYKVKAGDAHENFILLMDSGCRFSGLTVIKLTETLSGYDISYETAKKDGDEIAGSWKLWNKGDASTYTVQSENAKNGFIVLTSGEVSIQDGKFGVIKVKNRLDILKDVTYTTTLYFAGPGKDPKAFLRSAGSTLMTTSDMTIDPVWLSVKEGDSYKITLKPNEDDGGEGLDRVYYVGKDHNLILPENPFTNSSGSKKFVGWKDTVLGKTYPPWYDFGKTEQDRTFIAQWTTSYVTVSFAAGTGASGTMSSQYVASGNTFALPMCSFTATTGKMFSGWVVTGVSSRDYTPYTQVMSVITNLTEDVTVTAQWSPIPPGSYKVTLDGTNYNVYTDSNGKYTLPHNIFVSPLDLYDEGFLGWEFLGWSVYKTASSVKVAQAHSVPIGQNYHVIENGVVKFAYDSSEDDTA